MRVRSITNQTHMGMISLLTVSLALSACTTIKEARQHPPSATYESTRSEPALEQCLAGNLSWSAMPAIIHGEHSTELSFGQGESAVILITLLPTAAGTHVEVRELLAYGARVRHNVEACVSGRDQ